MVQTTDFAIRNLGPCEIDSPFQELILPGRTPTDFIEDGEGILLDDRVSADGKPQTDSPVLELAGPRRKIFFDPQETCIGIVTCGGLCPGLNNVIRDLVMLARYHYNVPRILGFRYGYRGMVEENGSIELTPDVVRDINEYGGSFLASSRGQQPTEVIVDRLVELGVNILYVIGGDGTMRGGRDISDEVRKRNLNIAVLGVPKTIDNDFIYMDQSFGFATAYTKGVEAIECAYREALGAPNGIGVVKLMGRHSGFIAAAATLASNNADFVLIPEMPLVLDGPNGFLELLRRRVESRSHAVVVVAEGAGQDLLESAGEERDASGNVKLLDIGTYISDRIKAYFKEKNIEANLKYIDPSYIIRAVKAEPPDSVLTSALALNAVHAGMAGKTEMIVALYHRRLVHLPIRQVIAKRNVVDLSSPLWLAVLAATGQPAAFG